jgi:hypothetical protein
MSVKFAGLQDNSTKSLISQAASAAQGLEGRAPVRDQRRGRDPGQRIAAWAKTGVPPNALGTGRYATANDQYRDKALEPSVIAECLLITTDSTISLLDTLQKRGLIQRRRIPATGASSSSTSPRTSARWRHLSYAR